MGYTTAMAKKTPATADKKAQVALMSTALMSKQVSSTMTISQAPAEKQEAKKAVWTGFLTLGLLTIPVQTFKATEEEKVAFNQIHICNQDKLDADKTKKLSPIYGQLKRGATSGGENYCPTCAVDVPEEKVLKGYQYAKGSFVEVSEAEKAQCFVTSDKNIHIERFVKASEVDSIYFAGTEYLTLDSTSKGAFKDAFAAIRQAMVEQGTMAIASTNQRGREQYVFIRPYGDAGLVVHSMFFDNEIRTCEKWDKVIPASSDVQAAIALVSYMTEPFDAAAYQNAYIRNLKGLINNKILGKTPTFATSVTTPVATSNTNLKDSLKASLAAETAKRKKARVATA